MAAITLVALVLLALHAWAPDMAALRAARALFGAAQAGTFAMITSLTRTWFPASVRTTVQGFMGVFFGRMGGASANLLVGSVMIGMLFDWRTALYVLAVGGAVLGVLFLLRTEDKSPQW